MSTPEMEASRQMGGRGAEEARRGFCARGAKHELPASVITTNDFLANTARGLGREAVH